MYFIITSLNFEGKKSEVSTDVRPLALHTRKLFRFSSRFVLSHLMGAWYTAGAPSSIEDYKHAPTFDGSASVA